MHRAHARYAAEADTDEALIARHAALVDRLARRVAARTAGAVSPDDLWSAGALGLLDAARRWDAAQGVPFDRFAEHRIRGAMLDELRRMDHLPRRLRDQADDVERARLALTRELQREPSAEELGAAAGLGGEELAALLSVTQPAAELPEGLAAPLPAADEQLERGERTRKLAAAVAALPERLQLVLGLHYTEGLTYREIGKVLDVSEPRVCQLHSDALRRLGAALGRRP
jgi:RNA polymerase sigma factor for flagellar operon FliA